jgi:protein gp37
VAARFSDPGMPYAGLAKMTKAGPRWTGKLMLAKKHLHDPLKWKRPRLVFVNSMSDLFHEAMLTSWIDQVFAVMALSPQHTFQILTKRPDVMLSYMPRRDEIPKRIMDEVVKLWPDSNPHPNPRIDWPLPNVWLGVSVENQKTADERIPTLLQTSAAVRFLSCEPLLGPIDLGMDHECGDPPHTHCPPTVDWIIAGGESGPGARPMHPEWPESLQKQATENGIPFFFKQWGEWAPWEPGRGGQVLHVSAEDGLAGPDPGFIGREARADTSPMAKCGKAAAGRVLRGREWKQFPNEDMAWES